MHCVDKCSMGFDLDLFIDGIRNALFNLLTGRSQLCIGVRLPIYLHLRLRGSALSSTFRNCK